MKIYQKLLKIQQQVDKFMLDKTSGSGNFAYSYTSGNQVLSKIRPLMNELGLLLKQEVLEITNVRQDYTTAKDYAKSEILTTIKLKFTWVCCDTGETDENLFAANGMNEWEKGLGSALTYSERYFLLKYFHIPTDGDDVDNADRKINYDQKDDRPWLNYKSLNGEVTREWENVAQAVESGKIKSIKDVLDVYKMSGKTKELVEKLLKK